MAGQSKTCLSGKTSSVALADHALMFSTHENQEYCSMWSVMAYGRCLRKLFPESFHYLNLFYLEEVYNSTSSQYLRTFKNSD